MGVPNCGRSHMTAVQEPPPAVIKNENKDNSAAALQYSVSTDHAETEVWDDDYMSFMRECCLTGDVSAGREAAFKRNAKIAALNLDMPEVSFDDLNELSKVITIEAGSSWIPADWKMMVGEVVLNRAASAEYPDTITEVIHQKGQYANANTRCFENLIPSDDCVDAACRLLAGERIINDASVVFQSSRRQGSGTYLELYDKYAGYTYLCYSGHPELYTK